MLQLPVGPNGRPYLPAEIEELNFSTDDDDDDEEEDESTAAEGAAGGQGAAKNESDEEETSETLVQDEAAHAHGYALPNFVGLQMASLCKPSILSNSIQFCLSRSLLVSSTMTEPRGGEEGVSQRI